MYPTLGFGTATSSPNVAAWSAADFNADGAVDGTDFGIWNTHKFSSSDNVKARNQFAFTHGFVLGEAIRTSKRIAIRRV